MTPPDSGFHFQCADPDCPLCAANRAIKPDSGEREVPMTPASPEQNAKAEAILAELGGGVAVLPLSLAQRILAALEEQAAFLLDGNDGLRAHPLKALAAELREVMGK